MNKTKQKKQQIQRRSKRVRVRIKESLTGRLRLSVFRSGRHISAQIIDDSQGKTLVSSNDLKLSQKKATKLEKAKEIGRTIAKEALKKKITKVVFDRGRYKYHGRVKAVAEGAREEGLKF